MNLGLLSGIFDWIMSFVSGLVGALFTILLNFIQLTISGVLFMAAGILGYIADFLQKLFRALAGIGTTYDNMGNANSGDPLFQMLTSNVVWNTFIVMLAVAFVLVIMASIVAIIRNEYNTDKANNSKGGILGSAVKSIAYFALVPVICVMGIFTSNILLRILDRATGGSERTISGQLFYAASYNANRVRQEHVLNETQPSSGDLGSAFADLLVNGMNKVFCLYDVNGNLNNEVYSLGGSLFTTNSNDYELIANQIDDGFSGNKEVDLTHYEDLTGEGLGAGIIGSMMSTGGLGGLVVKSAISAGKSNNGTMCWFDSLVVNLYYNMGDINYIVLIGGLVMTIWILFNAAFGLMLRLYKLTMLFMISPPIIALGPLDNHKAYNQWKGQFLQQVLSAYGTVVALNLAFKLMAVTDSINIFPLTSAINYSMNALLHALMSIALIYLIKDFPKMLSGFIGAADAFGEGSAVSKKVVGTAAKIGGAALNFTPAGAAIKAAGGLAGKVGKAIPGKLKQAGQGLADGLGLTEAGRKQKQLNADNAVKGAQARLDALREDPSATPELIKEHEEELAAAQKRQKQVSDRNAGKGFIGKTSRFVSGTGKTLKAVGGFATKAMKFNPLTSFGQVGLEGKAAMASGLQEVGGIVGKGLDNFGLGSLAKWLGGTGFIKTAKSNAQTAQNMPAASELIKQEVKKANEGRGRVNDKVRDFSTDIGRNAQTVLAYNELQSLGDVDLSDAENRKTVAAQLGLKTTASATMIEQTIEERKKKLNTQLNDAGLDTDDKRNKVLNTAQSAAEAYFDIKNVKDMNVDEQQAYLSQMNGQFDLTGKELGNVIAKSMKIDGDSIKLDEGDLAQNLGEALNRGKSETEKISEESINLMAKSISSEMKSSLNKISESIEKGLKGDDALIREISKMRQELSQAGSKNKPGNK